jgi:hypothetical protein
MVGQGWHRKLHQQGSAKCSDLARYGYTSTPMVADLLQVRYDIWPSRQEGYFK